MTTSSCFSTRRRKRFPVQMIVRRLGTLLALCWLATAGAQPLASWPLTPPGNGTPTPVAANVVAGDFTAGPGLGNLNFNANGARAAGWSTDPDPATDVVTLSTPLPP